MQPCRLSIKYSGALPTHGVILCDFSNTPLGPADRLDTIQDHRLFLVAFIVFSQPTGPNLDVRAPRSSRVRFYLTNEIQNGVQANEYPIVSDTRKLNLKECTGSSLGSTIHRISLDYTTASSEPQRIKD